jgi:hypothetical protein
VKSPEALIPGMGQPIGFLNKRDFGIMSDVTRQPPLFYMLDEVEMVVDKNVHGSRSSFY